MRGRAICVCRDARICRAVEDTLTAAHVSVEHTTEVPVDTGGAALIVVDGESRRLAGEALRKASSPVVIVGDSLEDDRLISLMLEAPVSHLVRDPGDRELGITSEKLVSGDVFGLEKYVAAGTSIGERVVTSDPQRRLAMGEVTTWAEAIGARRPIVHRLASVVDELLMNALHDAPRESQPVIADSVPRRALLRWASDDRVLAISVSDGFGSIRQRDVIDHVRRARDDRGRPNPATEDEPGAGLGLYLVLANVASLIVNVKPGRQTEVVCLFDLAHGHRRAVSAGVRSLHVFHEHST